MVWIWSGRNGCPPHQQFSFWRGVGQVSDLPVDGVSDSARGQRPLQPADQEVCPTLLAIIAVYPGGMIDNSPTFQRWVCGLGCASPERTAESGRAVSRPFG